jgi:hypothetical protein
MQRFFQPSPVRFKSPQASIEPRQQLERWSQSQRQLSIGAEQLYGPDKTEDFFVRRYRLPDGRMVVVIQQGGIERWWVQAPGQEQPQEQLCYYGYIYNIGYEPKTEIVVNGETFYTFEESWLYYAKTCNSWLYSQQLVSHYQHSDEYYQWLIDWASPSSDKDDLRYYINSRGFYSNPNNIAGGLQGSEEQCFDFRNINGAALYALRSASSMRFANGGSMGGFLSSNPLVLNRPLVVGAFLNIWLPDELTNGYFDYPVTRDNMIHATANQEHTISGTRCRTIDSFTDAVSDTAGYVLDLFEDDSWVEVGCSNVTLSPIPVGFWFSFLTARISKTSNYAEVWEWRLPHAAPPSVNDPDWHPKFDLNDDGAYDNSDKTPNGAPVAVLLGTLDGAIFEMSLSWSGASPDFTKTVKVIPPIDWSKEWDEVSV